MSYKTEKTASVALNKGGNPLEGTAPSYTWEEVAQHNSEETGYVVMNRVD